MYVKVSTVRSGKKTYRYLTLAESFRNEDGQPRSRIVARLGEVSEMTTSGELERIVDALSAQLGRGAPSSSPPSPLPPMGRWPPATRSSRVFRSTSCSTPWVRAGARPGSRTPSSRWWRTGCLIPRPKGAVSPTGSVPTRPCPRVAAPRRSTGSTGRSTPSRTSRTRSRPTATHELCNLANLDLRLVCYDLTSTYFEGDEEPRPAFPPRPSATAATTEGTGPRS